MGGNRLFSAMLAAGQNATAFWKNKTTESTVVLFFYFYFLKILFIHERQRERGKDVGRGRRRLPAGSPMQDSGTTP